MAIRITLTLAFLAVSAFAGQKDSARVPVLLELFTSEGCSSCPPADQLLKELDRQPVRGASLIVLSEHVDYWNTPEWKDPYSAHDFSERQGRYASALHSETYTPQLVVDGVRQVVGSNRQLVSQAIARAIHEQKVSLVVSAVRNGGSGEIHIQVAGCKDKTATVYFVVASNEVSNHISGGENQGRALTHVAVVRSLRRIGSVDGAKGFDQSFNVPLTDNAGAARVVAFLQDVKTGQILGAAQVTL